MELARATFDDLRSLIHRLCGLALTEEKVYLVRHRLEPVALANGCTSFEAFAQKLRGPGGPALHDAIVEAITTNETSFFRDQHPFETFQRHVLPELAERARTRKLQSPMLTGTRIRLWCAGVATGQEAYSLAMVVAEHVAAGRTPGLSASDFGILATDISARVLATAAAGVYSDRDLARGLTPQQIVRHFRRQGKDWVVQAALRRLIEFRRVNLVQPFRDLGTFDAILCRNVLIYFDETTRRRICEQFHEALAPGGTLLLGSVETLYGLTTRFESVRHGDTVVYRKGDGKG